MHCGTASGLYPAIASLAATSTCFPAAQNRKLLFSESDNSAHCDQREVPALHNRDLGDTKHPVLNPLPTCRDDPTFTIWYGRP